MLTWQGTGPTTRVSTPNDDDGVLAVGLEHHNSVTRGHGRNHRKIVEAHTATAKRASDEAAISVITDLSDKVGRVGELGGARSLVGALAAGKHLAGFGSQGLALEW